MKQNIQKIIKIQIQKYKSFSQNTKNIHKPLKQMNLEKKANSQKQANKAAMANILPYINQNNQLQERKFRGAYNTLSKDKGSKKSSRGVSQRRSSTSVAHQDVDKELMVQRPAALRADDHLKKRFHDHIVRTAYGVFGPDNSGAMLRGLNGPVLPKREPGDRSFSHTSSAFSKKDVAVHLTKQPSNHTAMHMQPHSSEPSMSQGNTAKGASVARFQERVSRHTDPSEKNDHLPVYQESGAKPHPVDVAHSFDNQKAAIEGQYSHREVHSGLIPQRGLLRPARQSHHNPALDNEYSAPQAGQSLQSLDIKKRSDKIKVSSSKTKQNFYNNRAGAAAVAVLDKLATPARVDSRAQYGGSSTANQDSAFHQKENQSLLSIQHASSPGGLGEQIDEEEEAAQQRNDSQASPAHMGTPIQLKDAFYNKSKEKSRRSIRLAKMEEGIDEAKQQQLKQRQNNQSLGLPVVVLRKEHITFQGKKSQHNVLMSTSLKQAKNNGSNMNYSNSRSNIKYDQTLRQSLKSKGSLQPVANTKAAKFVKPPEDANLSDEELLLRDFVSNSRMKNVARDGQYKNLPQCRNEPPSNFGTFGYSIVSNRGPEPPDTARNLNQDGDDIDQLYMREKQRQTNGSRKYLEIQQNDAMIGDIQQEQASWHGHFPLLQPAGPDCNHLSTYIDELRKVCELQDSLYVESVPRASNLLQHGNMPGTVISTAQQLADYMGSKSPQKRSNKAASLEPAIQSTCIFTCHLKNLAKTTNRLMQSNETDTLRSYQQRKQRILLKLCNPPSTVGGHGKTLKPMAFGGHGDGFYGGGMAQQATTTNAFGQWNQLKKMLVQVTNCFIVPNDQGGKQQIYRKPSQTVKSLDHSQQSLIVKVQCIGNLSTIEEDFYQMIQQDLERSMNTRRHSTALQSLTAQFQPPMIMPREQDDEAEQQDGIPSQGAQGEQSRSIPGLNPRPVDDIGRSRESAEIKEILDQREKLNNYLKERKQKQAENMFSAYNVPKSGPQAKGTPVAKDKGLGRQQQQISQGQSGGRFVPIVQNLQQLQSLYKAKAAQKKNGIKALPGPNAGSAVVDNSLRKSNLLAPLTTQELYSRRMLTPKSENDDQEDDLCLQAANANYELLVQETNIASSPAQKLVRQNQQPGSSQANLRRLQKESQRDSTASHTLVHQATLHGVKVDPHIQYDGEREADIRNANETEPPSKYLPTIMRNRADPNAADPSFSNRNDDLRNLHPKRYGGGLYLSQDCQTQILPEPKSMGLMAFLRPVQDGEQKFHQGGMSRSVMDLPKHSNTPTRYKQRGSRHVSDKHDLMKKTLSHSQKLVHMVSPRPRGDPERSRSKSQDNSQRPHKPQEKSKNLVSHIQSQAVSLEQSRISIEDEEENDLNDRAYKSQGSAESIRSSKLDGDISQENPYGRQSPSDEASSARRENFDQQDKATPFFDQQTQMTARIDQATLPKSIAQRTNRNLARHQGGLASQLTQLTSVIHQAEESIQKEDQELALANARRRAEYIEQISQVEEPTRRVVNPKHLDKAPAETLATKASAKIKGQILSQPNTTAKARKQPAKLTEIRSNEMLIQDTNEKGSLRRFAGGDHSSLNSMKELIQKKQQARTDAPSSYVHLPKLSKDFQNLTTVLGGKEDQLKGVRVSHAASQPRALRKPNKSIGVNPVSSANPENTGLEKSSNQKYSNRNIESQRSSKPSVHFSQPSHPQSNKSQDLKVQKMRRQFENHKTKYQKAMLANTEPQNSVLTTIYTQPIKNHLQQQDKAPKDAQPSAVHWKVHERPNKSSAPNWPSGKDYVTAQIYQKGKYAQNQTNKQHIKAKSRNAEDLIWSSNTAALIGKVKAGSQQEMEPQLQSGEGSQRNNQ